MLAEDAFSASYAEAREKFLAAASGWRVVTHHNPAATGPNGEALTTDVAVRAGCGSGRALVLVSGTHGAEGFAGSACQIQLLRGEPTLPADIDVVLVHALNPYGFAWRRRVNEDNVDVNRNFVDHAERPTRTGYAEVHPALVPADWGGPAHERADQLLGELVAARGARAVQEAITGGQYTHPDGLFYGGAAPVWSNRMWRGIVRDLLTGYDELAYIDLHTGLGPPGGIEVIFRGGRDALARERARQWYGDGVTESEAGTSSSTRIDGNTARALAEELRPETTLTAVTLEFGTQDGLRVLGALRLDNWVAQHADATAEQRATASRLMADAFAPDDPAWRTGVTAQGGAVIARAIAGLTAGAAVGSTG